MTAWIDGPGSLLRRPDAISSDFLFSFSVGPDELADPSKGLLHRVWMVDTHGGKTVTLYKASITLQEQLAGEKGEFGEPVELFNYTGSPIMEVDLGFDQNGNVVVCAERDGMIWLYWFDPREGDYIFHALGPGRTPRILLDDPESTTESDLLLFYATPDGSAIEMRQQRELYDVVHQTPATGEDLRCEEVAKANDYRLHVYYSRHNSVTGRYELVRLESAPYTVRMYSDVQVSQSIKSASVIEYVKSIEWEEEISFSQEMIVSARELTISVLPDGNADGFFPAEYAADLSQAMHSALLTSLVVQYSMGDEVMAPRQDARSASTTIYVIEATPEIDPGFLFTQSIRSIVLT